MDEVKLISPGQFEAENHFYPKALNAQLHPLVSHFLNLSHAQVIDRYCHLNPQVKESYLEGILKYQSKHFYWGGADLFYVTTETGVRRMVVLETNSCPSGQKSLPSRVEADEYRGYKKILESSFLPLMKKKRLPTGQLAVVYDKNSMENYGYAATLADLTGENVLLVPCLDDNHECLSFRDGVLHVEYHGEWVPIRAAFRYVTQKPWNRIPIETKTLIYNSTLCCLAGGRNKLLADKAYEFFNSEIVDSGLKIRTPETVRDVSKIEIPLWVQKFGGYAVVKVPYSNAGQGVFTITCEDELAKFMEMDFDYDQFIVQSLIGHYNWSSQAADGKFFHIGTVPTKKGRSYIADIRMMVYSTPDGFFPCAIYSRRAKTAITAELQQNSWDMLGTNLSVKLGPNKWDSDTTRLMLMDQKDFNTLGIGIDDLIEGYIQTILSIVAIDKLAIKLINKKGSFRSKLFGTLDNDPSLISEIYVR